MEVHPFFTEDAGDTVEKPINFRRRVDGTKEPFVVHFTDIDGVVNEQSHKSSLLSFFNSCRVIHKFKDAPDYVISFSRDNVSGIVCAPRTMVTITGRAKSRKTVLLNQLLRTAIQATAEQIPVTCPLGFTIQPTPLESDPSKQRMIYVIDTEHSLRSYGYNLYKVLSKTRYLYNLDDDLSFTPSFLDACCTQEITDPSFSPMRLLEAIELGLVPPPHLLFIDGAYDFVDNINDIEAVKGFVCTVQRILNKYNCVAVIICHANETNKQAPTDPGGHLGKYLVRKSDTTILVAKDKYDDTYFKFLNARYIYFQGGTDEAGKFQTRHDYSTGFLTHATDEERQDKVKRIEEMDKTQCRMLLNYIITNQDTWTKSGLIRKAHVEFNKKGTGLGVSRPRLDELLTLLETTECAITWVTDGTTYPKLKILKDNI